MSNDEFILGQGLGHQLELAFRRNGWNAADVHAICSGDILGLMRKQMMKPAEPLPELDGTLDRGRLFRPWKTITIGANSADKLIQALRDEEYEVSDEAQEMILASSFETKQRQVHLANLSHSDLGYEDGEIPHYTTVCRRIRQMGFELSTPEIAAELRLLNFDDQDERITLMAMKAVDSMVLDQYFSWEAKLGLITFDVDDGATFERTNYICVIP